MITFKQFLEAKEPLKINDVSDAIIKEFDAHLFKKTTATIYVLRSKELHFFIWQVDDDINVTVEVLHYPAIVARMVYDMAKTTVPQMIARLKKTIEEENIRPPSLTSMVDDDADPELIAKIRAREKKKK